MIPVRITIHCSATKDSGTVSWGAIRKWHMGLHPDSPYKSDPWDDIGYHFGIELVNDQFEILMGRMPNIQGAHVLFNNIGNIGICVVGNFDVDPLTIEHKDSLKKLCRWLCSVYKIPVENIYGHRDYHPHKSCPGNNLYKWLKTLRGDI